MTDTQRNSGSTRRFWAWAVLLGIATASLLGCADGDSHATKITPPGTKSAVDGTTQPDSEMSAEPESGDLRLAKLAQNGQFDQVIAMLKSEQKELDQPQIVSLVSELENYRSQRKVQNDKREDAFNKASEKSRKALAEGKIEEALAFGVEARILASDPDQFLQSSHVVAIARDAQVKVADAEKEGDFVEALNLYRLLDALFDDHGTYRDNVKRIAEHVRLLRIYAPDVLKKLLKARNERLKARAASTQPAATQVSDKDKVKSNEKVDEKEQARKALNDDVVVEDDKWQDRLSGVEIGMLRQLVIYAARQHVMGKGYKPLAQGALQSLLIFTDTPALAQTFPSLADKEKLTAFRNDIQTVLADSLKSENYGFSEAIAALDHVMELNKNTLKLPDEVLVYEMAEGATNTLDDFSAIIWPHEKESFARSLQGEFFGVGILIRMKDERIYVDSPIENSPAYKAGIKSGDFIVKVNGTDTTGWSLDQTVRKITGPKGTDVMVGIERAGKPDVQYFKLTRDRIQIESIKGWQRKAAGGWDYYIDPEMKIGYIRLGQFMPQTSDDLDRAVHAMESDKGLNGLILDLRADPGGLLPQAIEVVNRFVSSGIIVSTAGLDQKPTEEFFAKPQNAYKPFPVIVLINESSASASEIVSGALQDYHRALIMGSRSFGKGSVQQVFPIDNQKAILKITTQYYRLPSGRILHRRPEARTWGVEPDLKIDITPSAEFETIDFRQKLDVLRRPEEVTTTADSVSAQMIIEKVSDAQLCAALLVMKVKLVAERDKAILAKLPANTGTPTTTQPTK